MSSCERDVAFGLYRVSLSVFGCAVFSFFLCADGQARVFFGVNGAFCLQLIPLVCVVWSEQPSLDVHMSGFVWLGQIFIGGECKLIFLCFYRVGYRIGIFTKALVRIVQRHPHLLRQLQQGVRFSGKIV